MSRSIRLLVLVCLGVLIALPVELIAQRGGRGGGRGAGGARASGAGGNRNPRDRGTDDGTDPAEPGIGELPNPTPPEKLMLKWLEMRADEAAPDGNIDSPSFLTRLLNGKARPGIPTLFYFAEPSAKATAFERSIFDDERMAIA